MSRPEDTRGILYPSRLPAFDRQLAPAELSAHIRWFWIPRWHLPTGEVSRQQVLPFPASNLVVESATEISAHPTVTLTGPTTRLSHRDLRGSGWAVGALLRPAGIAALVEEPKLLRDTSTRFSAPELCSAVTAALGASPGMDAAADADAATAWVRAAEAFAAWADTRFGPADPGGLLANGMEDLIASDRSVVRVDQVAEHLGVSVRSVQRLARRYFGLPPLAVIRRYRLQEAAQRLREDSSVTISQIAADLGYADHAHLASDFRQVLGISPDSYRRGSEG